jgi:hypothetical protein
VKEWAWLRKKRKKSPINYSDLLQYLAIVSKGLLYSSIGSRMLWLWLSQFTNFKPNVIKMSFGDIFYCPPSTFLFPQYNKGWHTCDRVYWSMLIDIVTEWRSNQSDEFKDAVVWNPQNPKQMMNTVDTLSHTSKVKSICIHQNIGSARCKTQVAG